MILRQLDSGVGYDRQQARAGRGNTSRRYRMS